MTYLCTQLRSRAIDLAFSVLGAAIMCTQACVDDATQPKTIAAPTAPIFDTPTPAGTGNVTVDFSACPVVPIWFAIQDGTEPWSQVLGSSNVYRFDITSSKGGYAWVTRAAAGLTVQLASRAELTASPISPCGGGSQSQLKTVSGTLAGLGVDDVVNIGMGGAWSDPEEVRPSFTLAGVRGGDQDLIAYRSDPYGSGINDRMIIRRDQNVPNGGSVGTIDFASEESFAPAAAALTITGGGSDQLSAFTMYDAGKDCMTSVLHDRPFGGPTVTMRGVPAERQRVNDFHQVGAYATTGSYRSASESFHTLGDHLLAIPPALPTPAVSLPPGGHKRVQLSLTLPSEGWTSIWLWYREQRGFGNGVDVYASSAWIDGTAVSLAVPDLSGVLGWKASFLPTPDAPVVWGLYASGANAAAAAGACAEGARFFTTSVTGRA